MTSTSTNPLFTAEQDSQLEANSYEQGENGATQLSDYGMCTVKGTPDYVGAMVALNNKLTRGTSAKTPVRKGVKAHHAGLSIGCDHGQIMCLCDSVISASTSESPDTRNKILLDLILMFFNLRDIRGNYGKGEKTLSYWLFMRLYRAMPTQLTRLLHLIPQYGSWDDLNSLYEMAHCSPDAHSLTAGAATALKNSIAETYAIQLIEDGGIISRDGGHGGDAHTKISLAIKWAPREGKSLDKTTKMSKAIVKCMYPNQFGADFKKAMKSYRAVLSGGNRAIKTAEVFMASGNFSAIEFKSMPGRCMAKRTKAWQNVDKAGAPRSSSSDRVTCSQNYTDYLGDLKTGTVTAKGKSLFIHEIADKLNDTGISQEDIILYESMFDAHVNSIKETAAENNTSLGNTVTIADVSGSMSGDPMSVAVALALVASAPGIASPAWTNIVMTFHSNPKWVKLVYPSSEKEYEANKAYASCYSSSYRSGSSSVYSVLGPFDSSQAGRQLTWREKVRVVRAMDWGMNTDFVKALDLIAVRAISAGVKMPNIMCISDMQWDAANQSSGAHLPTPGPLGSLPFRHTGSVTTLMRDVKDALRKTAAGDDFTMILWNVRGGTSGSPCGADQYGFTEVSGFSTNTLRIFLTEGTLSAPGANGSTTTSWDTLRTVLDHSDYDAVRDLVYIMKPWRKTGGPRSAAEKSIMPPTYVKPNDTVSGGQDWFEYAGGSAAYCPDPSAGPATTSFHRQTSHSAHTTSPWPNTITPGRGASQCKPPVHHNVAFAQAHPGGDIHSSSVDYSKVPDMRCGGEKSPAMVHTTTPVVTPATSPRGLVGRTADLSARVAGLEKMHASSSASTTKIEAEISAIKDLLTALLNR